MGPPLRKPYLSQYRLGIHNADPANFKLYLIDDKSSNIPLEDNFVDYINCCGVLMHTSYPEKILREFNRILKKGSCMRIMVYNRNSIWYHLYVAYQLMLTDDKCGFNTEGITIDELFTQSTDGINCPIARSYTSEDFISMCKTGGFSDIEFIGGYLSINEINVIKKYLHNALDDKRLNLESKNFLRMISFDSSGLPIYNQKYAGIGGVYLIKK